MEHVVCARSPRDKFWAVENLLVLKLPGSPVEPLNVKRSRFLQKPNPQPLGGVFVEQRLTGDSLRVCRPRVAMAAAAHDDYLLDLSSSRTLCQRHRRTA
eukprot:4341214-Prymnesium_polylepis.1